MQRIGHSQHNHNATRRCHKRKGLAEKLNNKWIGRSCSTNPLVNGYNQSECGDNPRNVETTHTASSHSFLQIPNSLSLPQSFLACCLQMIASVSPILSFTLCAEIAG